MSRNLIIAIVGPSADRVTGSLLRPLNILYALKSLKSIELTYIPIKSIAHLVTKLKSLLSSDIVIISGINPWVSALISLSRRAVGKVTVIDVHGCAWYEASATSHKGPLYRAMLLMSEFIAYKSSTHLIVASRLLAKVLSKYFNVKRAYILPNATTPLFESAVNRLRSYGMEVLHEFVVSRILSSKLFEKNLIILVAPLPSIFKSNVMAYGELVTLASKLPKNVVVVITGYEGRKDAPLGNVVHVGCLTYLEYIALLLVSDALILPYPNNAICGGARNKVLEAGYCGKLVISTKAGMMHISAIPRTHYMPLEEITHCTFQTGELTFLLRVKSRDMASRLYKVVSSQHSFVRFKVDLLKFLKHILSVISTLC